MSETQVKLDIEHDPLEWVCLCCDSKGTWKEVVVTEDKRCLCPKCREGRLLVTIREAEHLDEYFTAHDGAWELMNERRKELGYKIKKVKR